MRVGIIAPEPILDTRAFIRVHNKAAKDALRETATEHWAKRIPQHFKSGARGRYGYMPRKPTWEARKRGMSVKRWTRSGSPPGVDLVYTGRTRDAMLHDVPQIAIGGRATEDDGSGGQLRLSMTLRFPFPLSDNKNASGVSGEQMKAEIGRILPDEAQEIIDSFGRRYVLALRNALATRPRLRKQFTQASFNPF